MEIKSVFPGAKAAKETEYLYLEAFPLEEQLPFLRMVMLSLLKPSVDLLAFYEHGKFCGFSFTVHTARYLYINFFAVVPALRGQGYGAKMFAALQQRFSSAVLCEAKAPQTDSPDFAENARRITFWEQQGFSFFDGQYAITNAHDVTYWVGTTDGIFDRAAYRAIFDRLSFGPAALLRTLKQKLK